MKMNPVVGVVPPDSALPPMVVGLGAGETTGLFPAFASERAPELQRPSLCPQRERGCACRLQDPAVPARVSGDKLSGQGLHTDSCAQARAGPRGALCVQDRMPSSCGLLTGGGSVKAEGSSFLGPPAELTLPHPGTGTGVVLFGALPGCSASCCRWWESFWVAPAEFWKHRGVSSATACHVAGVASTRVVSRS